MQRPLKLDEFEDDDLPPRKKRRREEKLKGKSEDSEENKSLVQAPAASRLHPPLIFSFSSSFVPFDSLIHLFTSLILGLSIFHPISCRLATDHIFVPQTNEVALF